MWEVIITFLTALPISVGLSVLFISVFALWRTDRRARLRSRRPFPRVRPDPEPAPDPRRWLRENRKRELREWEVEYLALCGHAASSRTLRVAALQRQLRAEGMYSGACDGKWTQASQVALIRFIEQVARPYGVVRLANGGTLTRRSSEVLMLEVDGIEVPIARDMNGRALREFEEAVRTTPPIWTRSVASSRRGMRLTIESAMLPSSTNSNSTRTMK